MCLKHGASCLPLRESEADTLEEILSEAMSQRLLASASISQMRSVLRQLLGEECNFSDAACSAVAASLLSSAKKCHSWRQNRAQLAARVSARRCAYFRPCIGRNVNRLLQVLRSPIDTIFDDATSPSRCLEYTDSLLNLVISAHACLL